MRMGQGLVDHQHRTAIFRHRNTKSPLAHPDALEFTNGSFAMLTLLWPGQIATCFQGRGNVIQH
jgi:hypothetical protein